MGVISHSDISELYRDDWIDPSTHLIGGIPDLDVVTREDFRAGTNALDIDATHRGQLYFIEGGAGVADKLYCVMKGADDSYSAVQITVG